MTEWQSREPESAERAPVPRGPVVEVAPAPVALVRWRGIAADVAPSWRPPSLSTALRRGFLCRCPSCGLAPLFRGYLRVVDSCAVCAAPLGMARADDAPPYFTIFVVGHIVVLMMLTVERHWRFSLWLSAAIWLPLTLVLSLALLRPIKGATVGLMLRVGLMKSASGD